jgi:hypothetical protein
MRQDDPSTVAAVRPDGASGAVVSGPDNTPSFRSLDSKDEASVGELFARLTSDTSELLRGELRLAKAEIRQELKSGAKGAGALGGAGFAGYMALLLLSFAAAWGLAEVLAPGVAFLLVGLVYGVVAAVLALTGKKRLQAFKPVPEQTVETLKEDARWLKRKK